MNGGTQVDLDWAGMDAGSGAGGAPASGVPTAGGAYLTDEEILGIEAPSTKGGFGGAWNENATRTDGRTNGNASVGNVGDAEDARNSLTGGETERTQAEACATGAMPSWMAAVAADPRHGGEAAALWREHQEFRAAFGSPEEARAVRELLPGGVKDVLSLREATASVERIDAALFSGDARAQADVVAEMARVNPAAFRAMFAEAARVLAGMGAGGRGQVAGGRGQVAGGREALNLDGLVASGVDARGNLNASGVQGNSAARGTDAQSQVTSHESQVTSHESQITNHQSPVTSHESPQFDPAAYAAFERATNETVARDVRGTISETLARVMPEGVAEGAAHRMGEDIFNEVHRALAADQTLSEQVAGVLRDRRFGAGEQARVAALLAGRAKQLVPSVARRVIGEWTSSVLQTSRSKAARQAAAASRVDIAAPGGSLDSMPLRAMSAREVNYAAMSDEEILGM